MAQAAPATQLPPMTCCMLVMSHSITRYESLRLLGLAGSPRHGSTFAHVSSRVDCAALRGTVDSADGAPHSSARGTAEAREA